jgi:O-antigen/teichoic acid export membrane protein
MTGKVDVHSGTVWTMIWWGLKLSLRFVSNIILTRLLTPEMFGIAAIGNTLINGIGMLSNFGIHQNIVRSARSDNHYLQTAWTIQLLRGLALTVIIVLLAKPFAWLYEVDGLSTFMFIVAASNLAMGLNNIESLRDYRHAKLRKIAIIDNIGAVFGLGVMVLWAWISPSYIALAVGALATTSLFTLGTYLAYPRHNCRLRLDKDAVFDIASFGKWVLITTLLAFASSQMDRLALGKLVPMHILGIYSLAWMWTSMPSQIIEQWSHQVFFPLVSQCVRNKTSIQTIWKARRLYILLAGTVAIVMYAISDILIATLYSSEYQGISTYIRQLSIIFLLYSIEQSYAHVLVAYGRPRDIVIGQVGSVIVFAAALLPAFYWANIAGVVALLALTSVIRILWTAYKLFAAKFSELMFDILIVGAFFPVAVLLHTVVGAYESRWYQISTALITGGAALIIAWFAYRQLRSICETV